MHAKKEMMGSRKGSIGTHWILKCSGPNETCKDTMQNDAWDLCPVGEDLPFLEISGGV